MRSTEKDKMGPEHVPTKPKGSPKDDALQSKPQEKIKVSSFQWRDWTGDVGVYSGEVNARNQPHGYGVLHLQNGHKYEGQWDRGVKHGEGTYWWPSGSFYKGHLVDNVMHGNGEYSWPDGQNYRGEFVSGRTEGHGVMSWSNGDVYNGYFLQNKRHGQGSYATRHGAILYDGEWKEGNPV